MPARVRQPDNALQTAKLNGLNPEAYLRVTLAKIADGHPISRIDELFPTVTTANHTTKETS